ncbi:MAG: O-antigen ligase family protein, partial [Candidatus Omnitrophica bacterium]|nr:O-antigen ligase family protein [Candidatus Omnitrophota bacterium]
MWTALAGVQSRNIKKIIAVWLFSSVIAAGWGVYQAIVGKVVTSSFGNPNILAGYLVLIFPIVLSQLFYAGYSFQKHKNNNIWRFFLLSGVLIIITAGLTVTKSRGAWLGISTAVLVLVFLILINLTNNRKKILLGAGIILICLVCFFMFAGAALRNQISKDVRPLFWKGSLNMIKASPLTGHGLGTFFITYPPYRVKEYFIQPSKTDVTRHAHCEYLEIAAETGLISLFFFVGMLILFFYSAARFIFQAPRSYVSWTLTGLTAGLAGFLAHNIVSVNMRFPGCAVFFWFALGISLGLMTEQTGVFRNSRYWNKSSKFAKQTGLLFLIMVFMIITVYSIKTDIIAQVYFKKGLKAGNRGDWVKAITAYQRSVIFDQSFIRPYYKMAYAYDQIGQIDEAVLTYKEILNQAPYYARTRANLGVLY